MRSLIRIITSEDVVERNTPLEDAVAGLGAAELVAACAELEAFRRQTDNLYERVRALFFLAAIHRYCLPGKAGIRSFGKIPFRAYSNLLERRFEESISILLDSAEHHGPNEALSSALSAAYRGLAFQTLADQVRRSVRSIAGNQWMFRHCCPAIVSRVPSK